MLWLAHSENLCEIRVSVVHYDPRGTGGHEETRRSLDAGKRFNSTPCTSAHAAATLHALRPNKNIRTQSSPRRHSERKYSDGKLMKSIERSQWHNVTTAAQKGHGETWRSLDAGKNVQFHYVFHVRRGSSSPSCVET